MEVKEFSDLYLFPRAGYDPRGPNRADRRNWIRVRRSGTRFFLAFRFERMDASANVRPQLRFEINIKVRWGVWVAKVGSKVGAM